MGIPKWPYEQFRREDGATHLRIGPYTRTTVGELRLTNLFGGWLFQKTVAGELGTIRICTVKVHQWDHRPEGER